ncbi:hypothetical protein AXG93_1976s1600 [Marchantia polymorpha subsp. ruderalis]|uniref:Uncharacterized protein n=1 Tax=Marchantia polymorpha subsp. ruderalis TaxID=1480154 RepID=A0A176VES1_MARPO|nr:hypothetical protein AXG93_1976s1600 [Marchantia polymorpha subsp. ruderalis]
MNFRRAVRSEPGGTDEKKEELSHLSTQTDGFLVVGLELDERCDHSGVGQQWVAKATGLSRPSRYLANQGLQDGPGSVRE